MMDQWASTGESTKTGPESPVLRPGDHAWRQRWLAAVRRRMQASPQAQARLRDARLAALAADDTLWADVVAAEVAFAKGEGEWLIPGEDSQRDDLRHGGAR